MRVLSIFVRYPASIAIVRSIARPCLEAPDDLVNKKELEPNSGLDELVEIANAPAPLDAVNVPAGRVAAEYEPSTKFVIPDSALPSKIKFSLVGVVHLTPFVCVESDISTWPSEPTPCRATVADAVAT